jgi:thiamine biosynthesis lipoprotein
MGTLFTASARAVAPADTAFVGAALDAALDTVAALERRLSNWSRTSELSRFNARSGGNDVSEPLAAVLDSAFRYAALTHGAFDPTLGTLIDAWDLRGHGRVPDAAELRTALLHSGWTRVERSAGYALGGSRLDLGGIAKGFALDRAASVLRARGVTDAALDAGGQWLHAARTDAPPCTVWVADPRDRDRPAVRLAFGAGSLSTSGQSERFFEAGGRRYGHILDPASGRPLATRASASVLASSGTGADALSTALLVLGHDGARAFAAAHPDVGVLWLEPAGGRVRAEAWNLDGVTAAPYVTLTRESLLPSLARNP